MHLTKQDIEQCIKDRRSSPLGDCDCSGCKIARKWIALLDGVKEGTIKWSPQILNEVPHPCLRQELIEAICLRAANAKVRDD